MEINLSGDVCVPKILGGGGNYPHDSGGGNYPHDSRGGEVITHMILGGK